jgi:hypothetical protein
VSSQASVCIAILRSDVFAGRRARWLLPTRRPTSMPPRFMISDNITDFRTQMQYQQGGQQGGYVAQPPQKKGGNGCLGACLAMLCCCCVAEEGCEACADCAGKSLVSKDSVLNVQLLTRLQTAPRAAAKRLTDTQLHICRECKRCGFHKWMDSGSKGGECWMLWGILDAWEKVDVYAFLSLSRPVAHNTWFFIFSCFPMSQLISKLSNSITSFSVHQDL